MGDVIELHPGQMAVLNGRVYACCSECSQVVRERRWFGFLHLCPPHTTEGAVTGEQPT